MPANTNLSLGIDASVSGTRDIAQLETAMNKSDRFARRWVTQAVAANERQAASLASLTSISKTSFSSLSKDVETYGQSLSVSAVDSRQRQRALLNLRAGLPCH